MDVMFLGMNFFMLFKVLRTLERLVAYFARVRFERSVYSEMRGDVVSLCTRSTAVFPGACEAEIVGRLSTDVVVAEMRV